MNSISNNKIEGQNSAIKILRVMRLCLLFVALSLSQIFASVSYSQSVSVSLQMNNVSIEDVLNRIEEETEFRFLYNKKMVDVEREVNVSVYNKNIAEVLNNLFQNAGISYSINGRQIVLNKKDTGEFAQQMNKVTGIVLDSQGDPIIGANIVEKGTTNGTITDVDGIFTLYVPVNAILKISYIGYEDREIAVNNKTNLEIRLTENIELIDEVVVIGYGTTTKRNFTGSVSSLKLENSPIALSPNMNALESLKGSVSGLDIGATNSAGGQPSMQVRGQNSISGSNDPLIVVDGIIFMGNINDINPNDIASFDILKDATSAAAYGSRSANGVIIISTKKGKTGKPIINLNVSGSMQNWHLRPELLHGEQWLNMVRDKNRYDDYSFLFAQQKINYEAGREIDWLDESTRTGWLQDYQVSVSGAGEKMNYYISTSYTDNQGIVKGDDFSRMTVLGKINTDITNWLQIGVDAAYTHSDYSGAGANLTNAQILTPYDMMYRGGSASLLEKYPNGQSEAMNPLWNVDSDNLDDIDLRNNFRMNAFMVVKLPWVKGLSYRLNYAGNIDYRRVGQFYHESNYAPIGPYDDESRYSVTTQQNYLTSANGFSQNIKTTSWVLDNILNYKNTFGKHTIDLTAVATRDSRLSKDEKMTGSDFAANGNTILGVNGLHYATIQKLYNNNVKKRNVGYFARASYSFKDIYYLTASYRRDGASVFGAQNKWGNFGAVGAAWRISGESFMESVDFLDDLKLKLSWGKNGNQGIDPYGTLSTVSAGSSGGVFYPFGNTGAPSYGIKQQMIGNALLGWETTEAWNVGFESSWLNNRLFADLDVYFSKTYDQIFNRAIPSMTGFNEMKSSMGEVRNRGVEMTLRSVNVQTKDWNWSTSLTFWLNRNHLNRLYGEDLDGDGKEDDDIGNNLFIGQSIHSIYGYKQDGIVQQTDVDYMKANGVEAGTPKYVDMDEDGVITVDDRIIVGNKDPRFKLNLGNTISWKNLELYFLFTGTFGGNGYFQESNTPAYMAGRADFFSANNIYVPYWTEDNPSSKYPAAWFTGDSKFIGLQSRAYVRLQDLTVSYTFNQPCIKNMGINNLRVFFTGRNLLTITGWKGGDPELGNILTAGTYPVATTLSLGANISF